MKSRLLGLCLALFVASAHAGFINETTDNPFDSATQVKIFGAAANKPFDVATGMGRDQPISDAIAQIVPRGFAVRSSGTERWLSTPVNWKGGKEWPEVLKEILKTTPQILVEIDLDAKAVSVRVKSEVAGALSAPEEKSLWDARTEDRTLKTVMMRWAKVAGWQLYWELPVDFPILASATVTGSFEEAVEKVVKAMQGAQVPPKAIFYENRVLRITARGNE